MADGKTFPIVDEKDFSFLVYEYMGEDSQRYFDELYDNAIEEVYSAKISLESEMRSYESSIEDANRVCYDIDGLASQLVENIKNAKRLNRDKIIKTLEEIIKLAKEAY